MQRCEICGATEKIQRHHISYEPEIIQLLCVDCHRAVHNHGVGNAKGWTTKLFGFLKTDAEILFKEGATNEEVAEVCGISYVTASHWRKRLGLLKYPKGTWKGENRYIRDDLVKRIWTLGYESIGVYANDALDEALTQLENEKGE